MNGPSSKKPKILRRLHASGALPAKQAEAKEKEKRTKEAADRRSRLFRFSISDVSSPIRAREGERHKDYTHKDTEREKSSHRIFRTSARLTGVFLFSLGVSLILLYFFGDRFLYGGKPPLSNFTVGILLAVLGLPLIPFKRSLSALLSDSRLLSPLLYDFLSLKRPLVRGGVGSFNHPLLLALVFLLGCGLSFVSYYVSGACILGILALAVYFFAALAAPECCVVIITLLLPFLSVFPHPTALLSVLLAIMIIAYLRKVRLGKRIFTASMPEVFILVFAFFRLFYAFSFSDGITITAEGLLEALIILSYFPLSGLLKNRRILKSTLLALVLSASVVSLAGIYQQISGHVVKGWLDPSMYDYINGRISAFFPDGANVLAMFLLVALPFCTVSAFAAKSGSARVLGSLSALLCTAALVLTWSRGAWLGAIASLIALLFLALRRRPHVLLGITAALPFAVLLLPDSVYHRFASILNLSDSSIFYRLSTWRSSLRLFGDNLMTGVGIGEEAWQEAYLPYAAQGTETVVHSHNTFLQIGIETGLLSLLIFVLILLFFTVLTFSRKVCRTQSDLRMPRAAAYAALLGLSVSGLTDFIFYNSRIFFLFFLVGAMISATVRTQLAEDKTGEAHMQNADAFAKDVPLS